MNYLKQEFYQILKSDENFFDFIQMNAFDGIWFWNLENSTDKWINPKFCNLLGYQYEELQGNQIQKIVHKEDQLKMQHILDNYIKNRQPIYEDEIRFVDKQGKIVWLKLKALVFDKTGSKQHRVLVTHTNITQQHNQKEELKNTLAKYESLLNNTSIFIIRTDLEGNYSYVNESFCERLNLDREDIMGKSSLSAIVEEDHQKCIDTVYKCFANPEESFFVQIRKPIFDTKTNEFGSIIIYTDWEYKAILDEQKNITEIQCVGMEITDRVLSQNALQKKADALEASEEELRLNFEQLKETQDELLHTQRLLDATNEAAQIGTWEINLTDFTTKWDKITKQIHEVEPDFVGNVDRGIHFYKEGYSQQIITRAVKKALEEKIPYDEQLKIITAKGNEIWVRTIGIPVFENGKCVEMYGTFQNIDKQKSNEINLQQKLAELEVSQKQLLSTSKLLETCNASANIGTWEYNVNTREIIWDSIVNTVYQLPQNIELDTQTKINFFKKGENREKAIQIIKEAREEGKSFDEELELINFRGNHKWVRIIGIPQMKNGRCVELYGTFQDITKQKSAELQLQEKVNELEKAKKQIQIIQNKLSTTLENTGIGIWELDLINHENYWDKQTRKLFGVTENEDINYENTAQKIHADDINRVNQMIEDLITQKISQYHTVYRTIPIDGKVRYHESKATLIKDEKGNPISVLGIIQDITTQKEYEQIIKEQNKDLADSEKELRKGIREMYHLQQDLANQKQQLEQIFDAVPAMIYQFKRDKEGNVSFPLVSKGVELILGTTAEQILNNSSTDIFQAIHPEDLLGFQSSVAKSAQTMQKWESELRLLKNNTEVWIHASSKPTPIDDGGIVWTGIMQNIDNLKATELKVQNQNKQLQETLNELRQTQSQLIHNEKMTTLGQLVASIAHEINTPLGAIRSSNESIEKMLANTLSNLPNVIKILSSQQLEQFNELVKKAIQNNDFYTSREKRTIKYNLIEQFDARKIPQSDRIADILVDIGIHQDKESYEPFIELENTIQILQAAYEVSIIAKSNDTIKIATQKASKIITTLKDFSRQDHTGEKKPTNINESLQNTLVLYQNQLKYGIEVIREMDNLPLINVYEDELVQVWTNLLHNSIQAIEKKGKIYLSTKRNEDKILVSIKDTGKGIADDIQARIFDAFFTTKPTGEGSGLGLNIVRKIIEKHEGKIWFETENIGQNTGTTFFVELPIQ